MTAGRTGGSVPPWTLAVAAMCSIQLSSALAVPLFDTVGAGGAAWLRTTAGAVIALLIARPPLRSIRRPDLPALLGLGVASGVMSVAFLAAIDRIPLGTAVAVEFLGPLTVAAIRSHHRRALIWPGLALVGVVLLTEPWAGNVDLIGVGLGRVRRDWVGLLHPAHPTHPRSVRRHQRTQHHCADRRAHHRGRRRPASGRPPHPR